MATLIIQFLASKERFLVLMSVDYPNYYPILDRRSTYLSGLSRKMIKIVSFERKGRYIRCDFPLCSARVNRNGRVISGKIPNCCCLCGLFDSSRNPQNWPANLPLWLLSNAHSVNSCWNNVIHENLPFLTSLTKIYLLEPKIENKGLRIPA